MTLTPGMRLASFEVLAPLGAGGMGEVYRARDTRLGRDVAIKVVSAQLGGDVRALARFEREARAVAALSHPNIVALYDVGRENGIAFAVMELLDGEPLDRLLARERMAWSRAIEIAAAVADGLAAAHARGIVHRDLKPANLFVTRDELVKILDFGLAKHDPFGSPALTIGAEGMAIDTEPGLVLGTVGYMSPEQVKGEAADNRSDVFSLGCVLYEMLAGVRPFGGSTPGETLAAILRDHPAPLPADAVPAGASAIVERCLQKNPDLRFQSARDLAFALRSTIRDSRRHSTRDPTDRPRARVPRWLVASAAAAAVAWTAWTGWVSRTSTRGSSDTAIRSPAVPPRTGSVLTPAYDAYVRGRHAFEKRTEPDLRASIRLFQDAIDADPTYAPAYAGLADSYGQLGYGSFVAPEEAFPLARAAARKALDLAPDLAEPHASLAYALMYYDWNFPEAEVEYKRALALNPNYATAHQWYAYWLTAMERPLDEAQGELSTAQRLDPLSVSIYIDHAYILHYYQRDEAALHAVRLALDMNPKFPLAYFWLGRIFASQGHYDEAETALAKIGPLRTWTPAMAALGFAYGKAGRRADAERILDEFAALTRSGKYASAYAIAVVYAGLGDTERAFAYLEAAVRERSHWLVWLKRDPRWNDIRSDPRFRELVRKVGLPS